jgi:hypothetical protein
MEHEYMRLNWTHAEGFTLGVDAKMVINADPAIVHGKVPVWFMVLSTGLQRKYRK